MKLKNLALLFVGMSLFACSSDDNVAQMPETKGLSFEIGVIEEAPVTKAGGPLYSQEATHNVGRVSVYVFKESSGSYVYERTYSIDNWNKSAASTLYEVPEVDNLAAGSYKFLAVGRNTTDNYALPSLTKGTTTIESMTASITTLGDEHEIFAGTKAGDVVGAESRVSIMMTRKVAGVLGYFKNIPQMKDGVVIKSLRLAVNQYNLTTNLLTGVGSIPSTVTPKYIFNMDLTGQTVVDGIYTGNDLSAAGVIKLNNSQLLGGFMIPTSQVSLTLGLYGGDDGETPIKTWTITKGEQTVFDITANSFFSLGRKYVYDSTDGDPNDPDNPNDDDEAIDLMVDQEITVYIDPTWGTVSYLSLQNNP